MGKRPRDSVEREIMDIIPERFDGDMDGGGRRGGHTRLILSVALGVLALAALGVAGRHLLVGDNPPVQADSTVPVIKPDDKPIKTKPDDRGGMAVPNQDKLVYQDVGKGDNQGQAGSDSEKLLPPAEKPQMPAMKASGDSASAAMPPPAAGSDVPEPPPVAAANEPSVSSTTLPPPVTSAPAPTATAAPPPSTQPVPPPAPTATAQPSGKGATTPAKPQQLASAAPAPAPPPASPATTASPAATPAAPVKAPAASGSGHFQVQLAAMKSEAEAQAAWKKALAANKDLLANLNEEVERADLGAKGIYFRLRAGPLDEAAAKSLCAELVKRNQVCIVARKP
jgi:hypothetical protein